MKCFDCGEIIEEKKYPRELKVEFHNPGTVFVEAEVFECWKCKSKYSDDLNDEEIFCKIEEQHISTNKK